MLCAVLSPLHVNGRRLDPGAEVELDPGVYRRLAALGVVRLAEEHRAIEEASAEADRFREAATAEAEAERDRLLAEAEAAQPPEPPDPAPEGDDLAELSDRKLKALVRDEALDGVDLRYRGDRLRDQIRAARAAKAAEPEPDEGAAPEA